MQSCLTPRLQSTVLPGAEVYMKVVCSKKRWAQFEAGWMFRKFSLCCSSKWLFPEETALACVCSFHQKVLNRNCVYLCISQPLPSRTILTFRHFFSFFFLTAPSELCTAHGYIALSVNTVQEWIRTLLQLPHQNTNSQFSQSPVTVYLDLQWYCYFKRKLFMYVGANFRIMAS